MPKPALRGGWTRLLPVTGEDLAGMDRRLWVLCGGTLASSMGFGMAVPFVSLYFHEELGASMSRVGLFFLATAVVRGVLQGVAGDLSDRLGRKRIMASGQAARAVAFWAMALAVVFRLGFWEAAGVLLLTYIAGAFYEPVANAAVSDLVPGPRRIQAYALLRIANNVGWGIGPMLGGFVSEIGYAWLFFVGGFTSAFSSWLLARHLRETHPGSGERAVARPPTAVTASPVAAGRGADRRFLLFCAASLFLFLAMSQWLATLSVFASSRLGITRAQLGLLFGLNGFMVVALQLPITRVLRRLSLTGALILGALVYGAGFFSIAGATSFPFLIASMVIITFGELIATPPGTTLASLLAPRGRTGRAMGLYGLTTSFGWSVGPALGGVLLDFWIGRPLLLWGSVAAMDAVAALGFWWNRRSDPSRRRPA